MAHRCIFEKYSFALRHARLLFIACNVHEKDFTTGFFRIQLENPIRDISLELFRGNAHSFKCRNIFLNGSSRARERVLFKSREPSRYAQRCETEAQRRRHVCFLWRERESGTWNLPAAYERKYEDYYERTAHVHFSLVPVMNVLFNERARQNAPRITNPPDSVASAARKRGFSRFTERRDARPFSFAVCVCAHVQARCVLLITTKRYP